MTINYRVSNMDQEEQHKPRCMVYTKIEKLIKEMQNAETGVPIRCQKIFLTTVPCAFTGYDIVEWLVTHLNIDEGVEALHVATLLCQHGYIFPVNDSRNTAVKDDATLYRFQSPYFWPSQNWEPDDVEYAIYLTKRSLRNKQRHGLEDYELAAYSRLQKLLQDKWTFISMQAEEQLRLAKDRKKPDRVVFDSQERAFWRVQRTAPGQTRYIEKGIRRYSLHSLLATKRKRNALTIVKDVEFLKRTLKICRMKTSKVVESLLQRQEQYAEHDSLLTPPQPSNPWISDDTTLWQLNSALMEVPTERRVKRWAFGLHELLADPTGRLEFEQFLEKEFSSENIHFWCAVQQLRGLQQGLVSDRVQHIYQQYLAPGAPYEINIDSKTMELTVDSLKQPSRYTFDEAQAHIFMLMMKDSYPRFLRSEQYKNLLANAINPFPKKKFFNFGSGVAAVANLKKKSPMPSPKLQRRGSISMENDKNLAASPLSQHSYSTGNLRELNDASSAKSSPGGSTCDMKGIQTTEDNSSSSFTVRNDSAMSSAAAASDAPRPMSTVSSVPIIKTLPATNEISSNGSVSSVCDAAKVNVVAPWEEVTQL